MVLVVTQEKTLQSGAAQGTKPLLKQLLIGIKRRLHRHSDKKAQQADAAFRAQRKDALERASYRCIYCGFRSQQLNEVHHLDDNHHNNDPQNLACVCKWCHPYHHIGEAARRAIAQGLEEGHVGPKASALIQLPESGLISAQDMNHLLRALSIALSDEKEAPVAQKIFEMLASQEVLNETAGAFLPRKADNVKRLNPADMAAALSQLTHDEYAKRGPILKNLRLMYTPSVLVQWGRALKAEQPAFADPSGWERLLEKPLKAVLPAAALANSASESVGVEALADDDEENDDDE